MRETQGTLLPHRWVRWSLGFLFWTTVALFFSMQTYLARSPFQAGYGWFDAFRDTMPQWYLWGLLSPFIIGADRRLGLSQATLRRRLLTHLVLGVVFTGIYIALSMLADRLLYGRMPDLTLALVANRFQWNILFYALIPGVYVAFDYYRASREREVQASRLEQRLSEARLQALKAQLHPHFLFNTLNAISAFMEKDPKTARRMTAHLGDLLRLSLDHAHTQEVTLAEELAFLDHYLAIERIRFEDRLRVCLDVAPETLEARVPSLLLQPLVENAVRHGITPRAAAGHITLRAYRDEDRLRLQIIDDGLGLPEGWTNGATDGVGLANTRERLIHLYDGRHHFALENAPGGGTLVDIALPFHVADGASDG